MTQTPLKFVSLGFGYVVQANNVWGVFKRKAKQSTRMLREAKEQGRYLNCANGREIKSLILLDSGVILGCAFNVITVYNRLVKATKDEIIISSEDMDEEEEDED